MSQMQNDLHSMRSGQMATPTSQIDPEANEVIQPKGNKHGISSKSNAKVNDDKTD